MPTFLASVEFRFECESIDSAGAALRRLQEAAQAARFDLVRASVAPASDDEEDSQGTSYGPIAGR